MATQISRGFKDISLSFTKHPITNDILILRNEDAIKRSVINLVRTQIGERFFNNLLGTSIESSMFELTTSDITTVLKEEISTLLNNFEPRIRFRNVSIEIVEDLSLIHI
jgi:phage baseplate assembly protein W